MKKASLFVLLITGFVLLTSGKRDQAESKFPQISENIFAAPYETTNKEYLEFINDLKSQNKSLLHKCIPDSAQWKNHNSDTYNEPMVNMYNWHPAYSMYPVVNITKEAMEL